MRRFALLTVAVAGAAAGIMLLLPRAAVPPVAAAFELTSPVIRGAYHVHSERSDGTGTLDEIASAAATAGLQFVILADHGDGTRPPEPPSYRAGVLCLDGVEISTEYGHYVALGMPRTPFPLGGHPRDVIDDVRRFGGFGFAAHPGSPKPALRWDDWDAPFDGLEWLNADSEWRDEFWGSLGRVLITYAFRPTETLAAVLDRPTTVLERWDRLVATRRVPVMAGADAHARLGFRQSSDPYQDRVLARVPAYAISFQAFVNHLILDVPLSGDAETDAARVLSALREGRAFTSVDGLAGLGAFEMRASSGRNVARVGEYLDVDGPVTIHARIAAPEGTTLVILHDGKPLYDIVGDRLRFDIGHQPGVYRLEARLPATITTSTAPWILTNPIYVGVRDAHAASRATTPGSSATTRTGVATWLWRAESSSGSSSSLQQGALADGTPALEWRFALAAGPRGQQYAALRFPVEKGLSGQDRLQLRVRSDAPRRLWAQLRAPGVDGGQRWGRTFYADRELRALDIGFDEFRPLGAAASERPPLDRVDSVLLVFDTLNTLPGAAGSLWIPDLWLAR